MLVHTAVKPYSCPKCPKKFAQKGGLGIHMTRIHLQLERHKCTLCEAQFSTRPELKLHSRIHVDKKYKCRLCPDRFVQKSDLVRHLKSSKHRGKKPYSSVPNFVEWFLANNSKTT